MFQKQKSAPGCFRSFLICCTLAAATFLLGACSVFGGGAENEQFETSAGPGQTPASAYTLGQPRLVERGSILQAGPLGRADYKGGAATARVVGRQDHGVVMSDGMGSVLVLPTGPTPAVDPNYADARELKLKVRELASQLIAGLDKSLAGKVALPSAFVWQDDFERTSSLGRFMVEQMYYEFNQRGLSTREYRLSGNLEVRDNGEFVLARIPSISPLSPDSIYLVGTYYSDQSTVFINARLIRSDGAVLRTGQIIMPATPLTRRMMAQSGKRAGTGMLEIRDFETEARPPSSTTAFDLGLDIH